MGKSRPSRLSLLGAERAELRQLATRLGEEAWRGDQVFHWIHASGVFDPASMTNLPRALRERLAGSIDSACPRVVESQDGGDGTVKLCLGLPDGYRVESVVIPREEGEADAGLTLCVSTQVGCRLRCRFCRSGAGGFRRDLTSAEIVGQVLMARGLGNRIGRVVFMGIGEPLDNYESLARSIRILSDEQGCGLALRRLVVSTIGRPDGIRRLGHEFGGRVGLAVSLHAGDPDTRAALVGSRDCPGLPQVMEAVRAYPLPARERVTIEAVLVRGENDSPAHARRLGKLLGGLRCRVNLIPLNPFEGLDLAPPREREVARFQDELARLGLPVFVRKRRGERILAACGQLAFGGRRAGQPGR